MANIFDFPNLGFGLGLRDCHYDYILKHSPRVDWFEIISENYLENKNGKWEFLTEIGNHYPLTMHGVSLSIGAYDEINYAYLAKLKQLATHTKSVWVSDHLAFNTAHGKYLHDLLPIPMNRDSLRHCVERVKAVQDFLERTILLENTAVYVEYAHSDMTEYQFLAELAYKAQCGILLDMTNVYVNSRNHGFQPEEFIKTIPLDHVVQIHLAGYETGKQLLLDHHNAPVAAAVWQLYEALIREKGPVATMVEWDTQIPEFTVLEAELQHARMIVENAYAG